MDPEICARANENIRNRKRRIDKSRLAIRRMMDRIQDRLRPKHDAWQDMLDTLFKFDLGASLLSLGGRAASIARSTGQATVEAARAYIKSQMRQIDREIDAEQAKIADKEKNIQLDEMDIARSRAVLRRHGCDERCY